jgi:hypothetical protein
VKPVGYNFQVSHLTCSHGYIDHVSPYRIPVPRSIGLLVFAVMPETKEETLQSRFPDI